MKSRSFSFALTLLLTVGPLAATADADSGSRAPRATVDASRSIPRFHHIFTIVMENTSFASIIGNPQAPFINAIARQHAYAAHYFAVTHPSLPNYLALTGGDTFGITANCTDCSVDEPSIADRVEASRRSWKAYMEAMPSPCFMGDAYPYVQKHNPFVYFDDIRSDPVRCGAHVVPYTQLAADLVSARTTPSYVWITPDMCHDMHDCSISAGDTWLSQEVPKILRSPAFTTKNSLLVITWDEDDFTGSNQVATVFVGPTVKRGYVSTAAYDHYSLLRTIEAAWRLRPLTSNDGSAQPMSDFFQRRPEDAGDDGADPGAEE